MSKTPAPPSSLGPPAVPPFSPLPEGGLTIHEYPPKLVKKSATGKGAAKKEQVAFMTRALFSLRHNPAPDEADALAVGLTHLRRTAFSSRMVPAIS